MYMGTAVFDQSQNASLYRRDLTYNVEYATILVELATCNAVWRPCAQHGEHHCLNIGDSMNIHLVVVRSFGGMSPGVTS